MVGYQGVLLGIAITVTKNIKIGSNNNSEVAA